MIKVIIGIIIPFLGTIIGSALILLLKDRINAKIDKALVGFAAGVMLAATIFCSIIPSIEESTSIWIIIIGIVSGMIILLLFEHLIPHHHGDEKHEDHNNKLMVILALTAHNIPEGIAIGLVLAGAYYGSVNMSISGALAFAIGVAIHNLPVGAVVSMPLKDDKTPKSKLFIYGLIVGFIQLLFSVLTVFLTQYITALLPFLLSFAAGAMLYVVFVELAPKIIKGKNKSISLSLFAIGFIIMMLLDILLE